MDAVFRFDNQESNREEGLLPVEEEREGGLTVTTLDPLVDFKIELFISLFFKI